MRPPSYRRHDLKAGSITERVNSAGKGTVGDTNWKAEVGQDHSSEETAGNRGGAKGLGYSV